MPRPIEPRPVSTYMNRTQPERLLALDLHPSSFGFAVFDGPSELIDWGIKSSKHRGKDVKIPILQKLAGLINRHEPEIIVIKAPRTALVRGHALVVVELARRHRIKMRMIPGAAIRRAFPQHSRNKYQIATAIAEQFSELSPRLGARRKVWQSERYSMSIFDAAATGLSYFTHEGRSCVYRHGTLSPLPR